jgi:hypothetical protein
VTTTSEQVTVNVTLKVTVSTAGWEDMYGVPGSPRKALVDDVRSYVLSQVQESAAAYEGGIVEVTAK